MMRETRIRRLPMALSSLVTLALAVLPLPNALEAFRPDFLVLVVLYWSIESPRAGGLTLAFMAGLALDVIQGVVLGQHALALTLMAAGPLTCACGCGYSRSCRNASPYLPC